jgi:hypothetical protein
MTKKGGIYKQGLLSCKVTVVTEKQDLLFGGQLFIIEQPLLRRSVVQLIPRATVPSTHNY